MEFWNSYKSLVEDWAVNKGINEGHYGPQFEKVEEELQELKFELDAGDLKKAEMEFGDLLVTVIILAMRLDFSLFRCLKMAYDKIKNRTGQTINGQFIKSEDL